MTIDSQIGKMNYFHDSEVIQVSFVGQTLKLEMADPLYLIEKYTIESIAAISEKGIHFFKVHQLTIYQSPCFGKRYTDNLDSWNEITVKDLKRFIKKGKLEFIQIENEKNFCTITLFWSSKRKKIFRKRRYIKMMLKA